MSFSPRTRHRPAHRLDDLADHGATVQGSVQVTAEADDDNAVTGVQFLFDGNPLGAEDTAAPYAAAWDSTTATNGAHTLTARARDAVNSTTSRASRSLSPTPTRAPRRRVGPAYQLATRRRPEHLDVHR